MNIKLPKIPEDILTRSNFQFIENKLQRVSQMVGVPPTSSSEGFTGDMALDSSFLYICISKDSWKKIALTSF